MVDVIVVYLQILYAGRETALKCLLGVKRLLERSDGGSLLNHVLIEDYCIWIQVRVIALRD